MITFSALGYYGRFGNQMFQYAALVGLARIANTNWGIPEANHQVVRKGGLGHDERLVLADCFELSYEYADQRTIKHRFQENGSVVKLPDNTDIIGYFQSDTYFQHVDAEIRQQFTFKAGLMAPAKEKVTSLRSEKDLVSVHVRRGDYLRLTQHHPLCTMEYYQAAMGTFPDADFLIFSDDVTWCKSAFGNDVHYAEGSTMYEDMAMMTLCDHHIIANSSFSWWGSYLGGGKVVAPSTWVGPAVNGGDWSPIYRKDWIVI